MISQSPTSRSNVSFSSSQPGSDPSGFGQSPPLGYAGLNDRHGSRAALAIATLQCPLSPAAHSMAVAMLSTMMGIKRRRGTIRLRRGRRWSNPPPVPTDWQQPYRQCGLGDSQGAGRVALDMAKPPPDQPVGAMASGPG